MGNENSTNFFINITNLIYPTYSDLDYDNFEYGELGHNFSWTITDESTYNPTYKIEYSKDGGSVIPLIDSQSWTSGNNYYYDLDFITYYIGEYEFNITSFDGLGNENSTIFSINITNLILPSFVDLTYEDFEYYDTGYNITFKLIDVSINNTENYYKIEYKLNEGETQTAVGSADWINNTINSLNLDFISESLGLYQFNITAYDGVSNSNSTIFNVNVTNLIYPEFIDLTFSDVEFRYTGYVVSWKSIDFSFNESRYYKVEYAKEGDSFSTLIESESWDNNTINSFSIDFINNDFTTYNFNITVYDGLGKNNMTSFEVEVVDLIAPVITGILSSIKEYGTDITLVWYLFDISSNGQYFTLNRTIDSVETTLLNQTWENQNFGISGRYSLYFSDYLFQYSIIVYNFTLYVYDGLGLSTNITFYINVTNSVSPEITFTNDVHIVEVDDSFELEWIIEDPSYNASTYDLDYKKNNEVIQNLRDDFEWENGDIFSFQILDLGFTTETCNITFYVIANDSLGLFTNQSFFLYVSNGIPIIVCNVSSGSIEYGNITDFSITIFDPSFNTTSIIVSYIYQEEYTELLNSTWISEEIFLFLNLNLTFGTYIFNINVSDGNELVNETFTYLIVNNISPLISLNNYDSVININDIINCITILQWSIFDISQINGIYSFFYEIDGNITRIISNEEFPINYTFDLILNNLTKELQVIHFTIIANDGLGLSSIIKFDISIESDELISERIKNVKIIIIITVVVAVMIGLVFVFMEKYKK